MSIYSIKSGEEGEGNIDQPLKYFSKMTSIFLTIPKYVYFSKNYCYVQPVRRAERGVK